MFAKESISNRRNARRKVNPRTGWSTDHRCTVSFRCRPRLRLRLRRGLGVFVRCSAADRVWERTGIPGRCTHSAHRFFVLSFVLSVRSSALRAGPGSTFTYAPASRYVRYAPPRAHAHRRARTPPPVLYNAAIDSRPLFHARDLLQSLQPVSGDSVQCPVSLPVSVRKIYFPMRYTGWHRENWTRSLLHAAVLYVPADEERSCIDYLSANVPR